jgi:hypothetical protein
MNDFELHILQTEEKVNFRFEKASLRKWGWTSEVDKFALTAEICQ